MTVALSNLQVGDGILPVANGGTGSATVMTSGSVVIVTSSGVHTQDHSNFFWDATNHRLGIGTTSPVTQLHTTGTVRHANFTAGISMFDSAGNISSVANLPVSNLNSGTSASSSTFWRGDGSWAALPSSGITQLTGDITAGPGSGSQAATLPLVNSNVGSFGTDTLIPVFTVNGKGLITAANQNTVVAPAGTLTGTTLSSNVVISSLSTLGIVTNLLLSADPVVALGAATKQYVDAVATGLQVKTAVGVATTANITLSGEQTIDGITTSASRILVKNQTTSANNGIYTTAAGAWSRVTDMDVWSEVVGAFVFVTAGTANVGTGWTTQVAAGGTIGSTSMPWAQFSASTSYIAGSGITLSGSTFSLTTPVTVALGGSGTTTAFTTGSVIYAGASGVYSQDNANYFWDATNHRLGLGLTTPVARFHATQSTVNTKVVSAYFHNASIATTDGTQGTRVGLIPGSLFSGAENVAPYIESVLDDHTTAKSSIRFGTYSGSALAERVVIDGSGNVGINSAAPAYMTEIGTSTAGEIGVMVTNTNAGTGSFAGVGARNGTSSLTIARIVTMGTGWTTSGAFRQNGAVLQSGSALDGGWSILSSHASGAIRFYTGGQNQRVTFTSAGSVGIGTSSPKALFAVQGADSFGIARFSTSDFSDGVSGSGILVGTGTTTGDTYTAISAFKTGFANWGNLILQSGGGYVGIGTATPGEVLDVNGSIRIPDDLTIGSLKIGSLGSYLTRQSSTGATILNANQDSFRVLIGGTELTRLTSTGLGIGITNPTSQLHTNGTVRFAGFGAGAAQLDATGVLSSGALPSTQVTFTNPGTGAVARTQDKINGEVVNVMNFGAKGDASTDDTAAIQAAINYAQTLSSVIHAPTVLFPQTSAFGYLITSTLTVTKPLHLKGPGGGSAFLYSTSNIPYITINTSTVGNMYYGSITDLSFISGNSGTKTSECCVLVTGTHDLVYWRFQNLNNAGLYRMFDWSGYSGGGTGWHKFSNIACYNSGANTPHDFYYAPTGHQGGVIFSDITAATSDTIYTIGNGTTSVGDTIFNGGQYGGYGGGTVTGLKLNGGTSYGTNFRSIGGQWDAGVTVCYNFNKIGSSFFQDTLGGGQVITLTNQRAEGGLVIERYTTIQPALTGSVNDWAPSNMPIAKGISFTSNGAYNITGMAGSGSESRSLWLYNNSANATTLKHQSVSSSAANRFAFSTGADIVLAAAQKISLSYNEDTLRWNNSV